VRKAMPNIHGFGSLGGGKKDKDDDPKVEEFSGGGKSSHTSVMRPNNASKKVVVTIYSNGFFVSGDEKGFRPSSDPANKKIIDDLKRTKQVPKELEAIIAQIVKGESEVGVEVKDKSGESYYPPKPTFKAFQGEGFSMKTESTNSGPEIALTGKKVEVDSKAEKIRVLLVLHPRKRAPQEFNLSHTASDIFRHVKSLTPPEFGNFDLVSGFPPKSILGDLSKTVAELKLKGATVTQRKC